MKQSTLPAPRTPQFRVGHPPLQNNMCKIYIPRHVGQPFLPPASRRRRRGLGRESCNWICTSCHMYCTVSHRHYFPPILSVCAEFAIRFSYNGVFFPPFRQSNSVTKQTRATVENQIRDVFSSSAQSDCPINNAPSKLANLACKCTSQLRAPDPGLKPGPSGTVQYSSHQPVGTRLYQPPVIARESRRDVSPAAG